MSAVEESRAEPMVDAKTMGTRDAIHVCNEIAESRGKPTQYLLDFANGKHLGEND